MCELIIGARYKRESSIIHQNLFFFFFIRHSLRQRQLSVTWRDKTLISRNQISAENREKEEGQRNQQKDSLDLIVSVDERRIAAEDVSFSRLSHFILSFPFYSHTVAFSVGGSFFSWGQLPSRVTFPPYQLGIMNMTLLLAFSHTHTHTHIQLLFLARCHLST